MELAPLIPLRSSLGVLGLAGAELTEVLGRLGSDVCIQEHLDAAKGFTCLGRDNESEEREPPFVEGRQEGKNSLLVRSEACSF